MILATDQLHDYVGKLAMVDGSFDPLHDGHIHYFREQQNLVFPSCAMSHLMYGHHRSIEFF